MFQAIPPNYRRVAEMTLARLLLVDPYYIRHVVFQNHVKRCLEKVFPADHGLLCWWFLAAHTSFLSQSSRALAANRYLSNTSFSAEEQTFRTAGTFGSFWAKNTSYKTSYNTSCHHVP